MKKIFVLAICISCIFIFISADKLNQEKQFQNDEFIKYRIHYGLLNAGYATLTTSETTYNGKPHYHVIGEGYSTGAVKVFFKVQDRYETYMDKSSLLPSKFIRKIQEGSYSRDQTMIIDQANKKLSYTDNNNHTTKNYTFTGQMHDMISAFYYLRSINTDDYKTGSFINLNIFMDNEILNFKLKILGRENKKTKFGTVECIKLRPYVLSGRVFKANESVTMWVTDDKNHIPVQIKAELVVGSLKADLDSYKNLSTPINFLK